MMRMTALLPLALLAGCGGPAADGGEEAKAEPVAQVKTAPAELGATASEVAVYGVAEAGPGGEHALVAPAEAIVDRIVSPNGTAVRDGQVILTLRPSRATATDLAKAASDAQAADAALARAKRLRADGLVSDAEVETARAAGQVAHATLGNLGMSRGGVALRAPVSGVVQGLTAKNGDQLAAGTTAAVVVAQGNLRARLGVDPALVQRVHPGQPLQLQSVSGDARASVTVAGVDGQVDATTRLSAVYANLPAAFPVAPGEALRGSLVLAQQASGITIPYAALLDDGGKSYVFVVKGGVAHQQDVLPGSSSGDRIRILNGLAQGDRVVTEGGTALEDGAKVREQ
ncbi:efflux RND transporter periplasmic adaptor subunit [Sphingomonas sp. KR3-1]|uniref:efflux RND transporter periplasmic adaptor subunit n=1 Tax=Sphingomonas sp. KR3-1 TaxID=3156611 RepID=UPI0032B3CBDD